MKWKQEVEVETSEYICLVKKIDGVVTEKKLEKELVKCNDCKHKTKCYSDVVMIDKSRTADIYESVQWCSLGERETE